MKTEKLNDDLFDDDIDNFLASYTEPSIDETKIDNTVDVLRAYMPRKIKKQSVMAIIKNEISYVDKYYWIFAAFIILFSSVISIPEHISPYTYIAIVSPIPLIIGLAQLIKGIEEKMCEIEKSCKYNYKEIIACRLAIICTFSMVLNLALCTIFAFTQEGISFFKILFAFIAPFTIVAFICLMVVSKYLSPGSVVACLVAWIGISAAGNFITSYGSLIEKLSNVSLAFGTVIFIIIFLYSVKRFYNNLINNEEVYLWN